jgi:dihydrodipicolinate synthase/N-acetylneuraminate lyase
MFSDASPAPVKYALSRVHDWIEPEVRLPLVEASDEAKRAVDEWWRWARPRCALWRVGRAVA